MAMRGRNNWLDLSFPQKDSRTSAFASHAGMASRFVGAPNLPGYGPSDRRVLLAAARTKAPKFLFETISTGTGSRVVGAGYGVDYVSTRKVSSGDLPKMTAWPALTEKEWENWKREVMSLATVVPLLSRLLGPDPPDAPTVEALMIAYDVDAVYARFPARESQRVQPSGTPLRGGDSAPALTHLT